MRGGHAERPDLGDHGRTGPLDGRHDRRWRRDRAADAKGRRDRRAGCDHGRRANGDRRREHGHHHARARGRRADRPRASDPADPDQRDQHPARAAVPSQRPERRRVQRECSEHGESARRGDRDLRRPVAQWRDPLAGLDGEDGKPATGQGSRPVAVVRGRTDRIRRGRQRERHRADPRATSIPRTSP